MRKLDPEKKALIVAKMRSSEKCKGKLRRGDSFCALGCICDVSGVGQWKWDIMMSGWYYDDHSYNLPRSVQETMGLPSDPCLVHEGESVKVCHLNDGRWGVELSLNEIADLIEEQW